MHHYRSTIRQYKKHSSLDRQRGGCSFCQDTTIPGRTLAENKTMYLIAIRTKYDVFEGRNVENHLMVIPKRHVETIHEFTDAEKLDMMTIVGDYEPKGYNVYARGVGSVSRSVTHQHTHLIKLVEKRMKYLVHLKKPHLLING